MGRRWLLLVPAPLVVAACVAVGPASPSVASAAVSSAPNVPAGTSRPGPAPGGPLRSHVLPTGPSQSGNWSGYAVGGAGLQSVVGRWRVPTVLAPLSHRQLRKNQYSGTWVGIDGFFNQDLIQAGTEEDYLHGSTFYQAWWEILPAPETPISRLVVTVHPGDAIAVTITKGFPRWTITLTDTTTNQSFTTQQTYRGPGSSAEWIHEAVTVGGRISKMPRDTAVTFDGGLLNGASPGLAAADSVTLVLKSGAKVEVPSAPDADHDGFTVAYGSATPRAPAS